MTDDPTQAQNIAYLIALARQEMARRDVDTVDTQAIEAILQEETASDDDKAAAIQELLTP